MNLREWADGHGLHYRTALKWYHDGVLPVESWRVGKLIMVGPVIPVSAGDGVVAVYARVSSSGQSEDLDRQVARLCSWATGQGLDVGRVVSEVGSGLNGKRRKLMRLLSDPDVGTVVVEHRDRFARFGFEMAESALAASGRRILVVDDGEIEDDLVRDMTEVLTSMCARLYGKRSARNRAERAMEAAGAEVQAS